MTNVKNNYLTDDHYENGIRIFCTYQKMSDSIDPLIKVSQVVESFKPY